VSVFVRNRFASIPPDYAFALAPIELQFASSNPAKANKCVTTEEERHVRKACYHSVPSLPAATKTLEHQSQQYVA
jgi:hypothetical protein